eukprot:4710128-Prymnesium_polylepis.2
MEVRASLRWERGRGLCGAGREASGHRGQLGASRGKRARRAASTSAKGGSLCGGHRGGGAG